MMKRVTNRDPGLQKAFDDMGLREFARRMGVTASTVSSWRRVPAERVLEVEAKTGVSRRQLRPDLFGAPRSRPPVALRPERDRVAA